MSRAFAVHIAGHFKSATKLPFIRQTLALSGPEVLGVLVQFISGLVVAKLLGPELLGYLSTASLVFLYGTVMQLGAFDGLMLKVPLMLGQGKNELVDSYIDNSYTFVICALSVYTTVVLCVIFWTSGSVWLWYGVVCNLIAAFLYHTLNYKQAALRLSYQFRRLSYSQVNLVLARSVIIILLTLGFGVYGTFTALFVSYFPPLLMHLKWGSGVRLRCRISWEVIKDLIGCGMPMVLIGFIDTSFATIDRWLIITNIGVNVLGYYTILLTFAGAMMLVPAKIVSLMVQYLREIYGTSSDKELVWGYCQKFTTALCLLLIPILLALNEFIFVLFRGYLVQYRSSLSLSMIFQEWVWIAAYWQVINAYFVITDQKKWTILAQIISVVCAAVLSIVAIRLGLGMTGIAWAKVISTFILVSLMMGFAAVTGIKETNIGVLILTLGGCTLPATAWLFDVLFPRTWENSWSEIAMAVLQRMFVCAVLLSSIVWAMQRFGFWSGMRMFFNREVPLTKNFINKRTCGMFES